MAIEFKRDPYVAGFAVVVVLCATALVWHGDVTLKEAAAVVAASLFAPGVLGRSDEDEDEEKTDPNGTVRPVEKIVPTSKVDTKKDPS